MLVLAHHSSDCLLGTCAKAYHGTKLISSTATTNDISITTNDIIIITATGVAPFTYDPFTYRPFYQRW